MLIICDENEKMEMRKKCKGFCKDCVLANVECPLENHMIITTKEVSKGNNLEVKLYNC